MTLPPFRPDNQDEGTLLSGIGCLGLIAAIAALAAWAVWMRWHPVVSIGGGP